MKPRQTVKNYNNSNVPPNHRNTTAAMPLTLSELDLAKLGLSREDMLNVQALGSNLTNQDEIMKYLQTFYGKNGTDILQKLPPLNDWPLQTSQPTPLSPPGFPRMASNIANIAGGSGVGVAGPSGSGTNFCHSGANSVNSNNSGLLKHDLHFSTSNPQSQHQTLPNNVNLFRASTSNVSSPQHHQPLLSQQKSVLSLHQHHQQSDMSNRRLNQAHHMSATNASFASLATANTAAIAASSSSSNIGSNCLSALASTTKPSITSGIHVGNIMDTFNSFDNMFYVENPPSPLSKDISSANSQQTLIRQLLKTTDSQLNTNTSPSPSSLQNQLSKLDNQSARNIINNNNMPPPHHAAQQPPSAISPPQTATLSSVPKSLLNLAACSSSKPPSTNASSSLSSASRVASINQLLSSQRVPGMSTTITNPSSQTNLNSHQTSRQASSRVSMGNDISILKQGTSNGSSSFSSYNQNHQQQSQATNKMPVESSSNLTPTALKQLQASLSLNNIGFNTKTPSTANVIHNQPQHSTTSTPKESFLAGLQERAARAGISIGEISKSLKTPVSLGTSLMGSSNNSNNLGNNLQAQSSSQLAETNAAQTSQPISVDGSSDRKEIESALSRVEARNDLSLLYPPMLLAPNSQKQINAFSAGIQDAEDSELFTKEVKRIVSEECNIIYECKECDSLFRSLANLVRHKRTFCSSSASERNGIDNLKRLHTNSIFPVESSIRENHHRPSGSVNDSRQSDRTSDNISTNGRSQNHDLSATVDGSNVPTNTGSLMRQQSAESRFLRTNRREASIVGNMLLKSRATSAGTTHTPSPAQTSLSKLLQSQPKNRLHCNKDSLLLSALKISGSQNPIESSSVSLLQPGQPSCSVNPSYSFELDNNAPNYSFNDVNEQLVRNSSLAKTLLNEKVRGGTSVAQSLIELSKAESAHNKPTPSKRANPKRKFLEDCIQKVKRDKLFNEEDECQPDINGEEAGIDAEDDGESLEIGEHESTSVKDPCKTASDAERSHSNDEHMSSSASLIPADESPDQSDAESTSGSSSSSSSSNSSSSTGNSRSSSGSSSSNSDTSSSDSDSQSSSGSNDSQPDDSIEIKRSGQDKSPRATKADRQFDLDSRIERQTPSRVDIDLLVDGGDSEASAHERGSNRVSADISDPLRQAVSSHQSTPSQGSISGKVKHHERGSRTSTSTSPSTSSIGAGAASGSSGLMKLKIQLKTRPDEKSKVYEIV